MSSHMMSDPYRSPQQPPAPRCESKDEGWVRWFLMIERPCQAVATHIDGDLYFCERHACEHCEPLVTTHPPQGEKK
jgi:hypothetical protein